LSYEGLAPLSLKYSDAHDKGLKVFQSKIATFCPKNVQFESILVTEFELFNIKKSVCQLISGKK